MKNPVQAFSCLQLWYMISFPRPQMPYKTLKTQLHLSRVVLLLPLSLSAFLNILYAFFHICLTVNQATYKVTTVLYVPGWMIFANLFHRKDRKTDYKWVMVKLCHRPNLDSNSEYLSRRSVVTVFMSLSSLPTWGLILLILKEVLSKNKLTLESLGLLSLYKWTDKSLLSTKMRAMDVCPRETAEMRV